MIAVLALAAIPALGAASPDDAGRYQRVIKVRERKPAEERLMRRIREWGARQGRALTFDPRLFAAAQKALVNVPRSPDERFDITPVRRHCARLGSSDVGTAAVTLRSDRQKRPASVLWGDLEAELETHLRHRALSHFAVAVGRQGQDSVLVALFAWRPLRLFPSMAKVKPGQNIRLRGTVDPAITATDQASSPPLALEWLVVAADGGRELLRAPAQLRHGRFEVQVRAPDKPGVLQIQFLLHRGRGPEVAASLRVGVGISPWHGDDGAIETQPVHHAALDGPANMANLHDSLASLILGARGSQGLPLPAQSAILEAVAQGHAEDMVRHDYFAHVARDGSDLSGRLKRQGVRYRLALENLAAVSLRDADETEHAVLRAWLESPSHRVNLLHPKVNAFGLGVVTAEDGRLIAVLVLAVLDSV